RSTASCAPRCPTPSGTRAAPTGTSTRTATTRASGPGSGRPTGAAPQHSIPAPTSSAQAHAHQSHREPERRRGARHMDGALLTLVRRLARAVDHDHVLVRVQQTARDLRREVDDVSAGAVVAWLHELRELI